MPRPAPLPATLGAGVAAFAVVVVVVVLSAALAGPAGAQSTSLAPTTTVPAENPGSTAAGVVFFVVCGVIVGGALVLYLTHRRPKA